MLTPWKYSSSRGDLRYGFPTSCTQRWAAAIALLAVLVGAQGAESDRRAPAARGEAGQTLNALDKALGKARAQLGQRLTGVANRELMRLLEAPGRGLELRRRMAQLRAEARLDILLALQTVGPGLARLVAATEDLSVRARLEEDPAARAIVQEIAAAVSAEALAGEADRAGDEHRARGHKPEGRKAGGRKGAAKGTREDTGGHGDAPGDAAGHEEEEPARPGVPVFFCRAPAAFLIGTGSSGMGSSGTGSGSMGSGESQGPELLVMAGAARLGQRGVLIGAVRVQSLEPFLQEALEASSAPRGTRWSAFMLPKSKAPPKGSLPPAPSPKIVAGQGVGKPVPAELATALTHLDRTAWPRTGTAGKGDQPRQQWLALRDGSGSLVGGLGFNWRPQAPPVAGVSAVPAFGWPAAVVGLAAVLTGSGFMFARSRRRRGPAPVSGEGLTSQLRALARDFTDPALIAPVVERSVERALRKAPLTPPPPAPTVVSARSGLPAQAAGRPENAARQALLTAMEGRGFPLALIAVDSDAKVFFWSQAADELWGGPASQRLGKTLSGIGFCGLEEEIRTRSYRALQLGVIDPPVRLSFERQGIRHVQLSFLPFLSAGPSAAGRPLGGVLIAGLDVTREVENDTGVRVLGQFQKALSASLPLPLVVVDPQGRIRSWNGAMERLTDVPESQALGKELVKLSVPSGPRASFPFEAPDQPAQGTLHAFGEAAAALSAAGAPPPAPLAPLFEEEPPDDSMAETETEIDVFESSQSGAKS